MKNERAQAEEARRLEQQRRRELREKNALKSSKFQVVCHLFRRWFFFYRFQSFLDHRYFQDQEDVQEAAQARHDFCAVPEAPSWTINLCFPCFIVYWNSFRWKLGFSQRVVTLKMNLSKDSSTNFDLRTRVNNFLADNI